IIWLILGLVRSDVMDQKKIRDSAKKHSPTTHKVKHVVVAFCSGGLLAVLSQALMMFYETIFVLEASKASTLSIVSVIIITSILTGLGIYDKAVQFCGAGLFIPISGFANSLTSCALEGKSEGLIYGIGTNMFKLAGSVLTYGISAAFVFGMLRYLLFGA
ncbi:MAG: SpoVA/SpoVAEb family sporulation membrane protein, partial [Longicatena sp.]